MGEVSEGAGMSRARQADAAVKVHEFILGCIAMFLAFLALGWLALHGDDIRQQRLAAERLELPEAPTHSWAAHPNDAQRGDAWKRICEGSTNWDGVAQRCR